MFRPLTLLLLAALFLLYFTGLADSGLLGPDEPRYAAIGRQMARSHDFVTPTLWGTPWYEKPALLYWLIAVGNLAGLGPELAPRLPIALCAVAFIIFFYTILAKNINPRIALYSSTILATLRRLACLRLCCRYGRSTGRLAWRRGVAHHLRGQNNTRPGHLPRTRAARQRPGRLDPFCASSPTTAVETNRDHHRD